MKSYYKYIKPYISYFIIGPILMIVEVIGEIVMPYLFKQIVNGIQTSTFQVSDIITLGILMILMAFVMMAGGVGGCYYAIKASSNFACDLRKDVFNKIQDFSFANVDKFSTGSLVTRLTNDITQLQNLIAMGLRMLLRAPGMLIGAIIVAVISRPSLAVIVLCAVPILGLAIFSILRVSFPRFNIMQGKIDKLNATVQENVTNIRVVKSFVREEFEEAKFEEANNELKTKTLDAMNYVILTMPIMTLAMNVTTVLIVWFGGNMVVNGTMKIGDLNMFITYVSQILMSLMMVAMIILNSTRALASSKRIKEVLETEIDLTDTNAREKSKQVNNGDIEFRNVSFRYYKDNKENVLENINFKIKHGEIVGIIGSTGSGKTSLVSLIPRLYDSDEGEVFVDGTNVRDYSLESLRNGVGIVLQKNVLFTGTIKENLLWGDETANDEELISAAQKAQADSFIKAFTQGYDTNLGQGGGNVSGGQKQRLCIARALLKKPKILILDDSTSAVDTATETKIKQSFTNALKDSTKIIIAQRISSVSYADKIIVLDEGKIVGMGTHQELLSNCEEYQEIYYSQMEKEDNA